MLFCTCCVMASVVAGASRAGDAAAAAPGAPGAPMGVAGGDGPARQFSVGPTHRAKDAVLRYTCPIYY
ncbi:exported hypothetical protein [Paraburkholderia ribeironis]|uniref:Secreted protein n=1 Tax=Paraburkholderia ribeironis TaxID=1247936 RepID=A0A1N7SN19_9BURK|nr:exported hypothetical protein [Paraburkholderia ribeironis]